MPRQGGQGHNETLNRWYSDDPNYYLTLIGEFHENQSEIKKSADGLSPKHSLPRIEVEEAEKEEEEDYNILMEGYQPIPANSSGNIYGQKMIPVVHEEEAEESEEQSYHNLDQRYHPNQPGSSYSLGYSENQHHYYTGGIYPGHTMDGILQPQYQLRPQNIPSPFSYPVNFMETYPYSRGYSSQEKTSQGYSQHTGLYSQSKPYSPSGYMSDNKLQGKNTQQKHFLAEEQYAEEEEEQAENEDHHLISHHDYIHPSSGTSQKSGSGNSGQPHKSTNPNKTNIDKYKAMVDVRGCSVLLVKGLESSALSNELISSMFCNFGNVSRLFFAKVKGWAYIEYPTKELASIAKEMVSGLTFYGHQLMVGL